MSSYQLLQQPIEHIDVDEMTMDELLAFSFNPQKKRKSSKRRMNIALNPESKNVILEEIANSKPSFLVYSNGLLISPEGEIANPEDYNISTDEIHRQVNTYLAQIDMNEPTDECIITSHENTLSFDSEPFSDNSQFAVDSLNAVSSGILQTPTLLKLTRSETIRIDPRTSGIDARTPDQLSNNVEIGGRVFSVNDSMSKGNKHSSLGIDIDHSDSDVNIVYDNLYLNGFL